jgi:hypothetical protein
MGSQINELVAMRDVLQLEAAEGLLKLGDRRVVDWLMQIRESEDEDISGAANELLETPETQRMLEVFKAESEAERRAALSSALTKAKARLQKGKTVFLHKMVYVPGDMLFMKEADVADNYNVLALDQLGLEGWEVVSLISLQAPAAKGASPIGAYFLVKKLVAPDESTTLDEL